MLLRAWANFSDCGFFKEGFSVLGRSFPFPSLLGFFPSFCQALAEDRVTTPHQKKSIINEFDPGIQMVWYMIGVQEIPWHKTTCRTASRFRLTVIWLAHSRYPIAKSEWTTCTPKFLQTRPGNSLWLQQQQAMITLAIIQTHDIDKNVGWQSKEFNQDKSSEIIKIYSAGSYNQFTSSPSKRVYKHLCVIMLSQNTEVRSKELEWQ